MLTFSVNNSKKRQLYILRVKEAIEKNILYFKKMNGDRFQEAVQKTYINAIDNQKEGYDNLEPYIKKLARTVLKERQIEIPKDMVDDGGDVSYHFLELTSEINEDFLEDRILIEKKFKKLYLIHKEDFLKIHNMYKVEANGFSLESSHTIKNKELKKEIFKMVENFGAEVIFKSLFDFFQKLDEFTTNNYIERIKKIRMEPTIVEVLDDIPDIPKIQDESGNYYLINKNNLTMERNPDLFEWDTIADTRCDIIALDISPFMNYVFEQIYVPQGINTKMIEWCDDIYKLTTPGGEVFVDIPREKFISKIKTELVTNLIGNRIREVIAISVDTIYYKPPRSINYEFIRLELSWGKIIDLQTEIRIHNRL